MAIARRSACMWLCIFTKNLHFMMYLLVVMEWVPKSRFSCIQKQPKNGFDIAIFDDFLSTISMFHFEKSSKMVKIYQNFSMALPKSETRVLGTRYITIIPTYLYNVSLLKLPRWPSLKPLKKEIIEALVCHTWMNICCLDYPQNPWIGLWNYSKIQCKAEFLTLFLQFSCL